jgi:hypothetical protein
MAIGEKRTLRQLIGREHLELLTRRCEIMLLDAFARSGMALGPRSTPVHVVDVMGIAAARVLCASGLLTQQLDGDQPSEVYGYFKMTPAGKQVARGLA